jgi:formamidopyrimidine-DNA glycosylase
MPELPEVQTIASELNRKLKHKVIKSVSISVPKMVSVGPNVVSNIRTVKSYQVVKFVKLLQGQRISSVKRRAKLLIFDLSGPLSILAHLKMTGQFIFEDKKLRTKTRGLYRIINKPNVPKVLLPCKYTHVIFTFRDGSRLYFNDVRKFGYLKLVRDNELPQVKELQEFGPEPLDKKFTYQIFFSIIKSASPKTKIKQFLIDSTKIAGIGNIYSDEILFHAKVRPTRLVSRMTNNELREIYKNIKSVLKKAIAAKGSSVGDFVRTDGSWGEMGKFHFVYARGEEKCKVCGSTIATVKMNGRTSSYCPKCQR